MSKYKKLTEWLLSEAPEEDGPRRMRVDREEPDRRGFAEPEPDRGPNISFDNPTSRGDLTRPGNAAPANRGQNRNRPVAGRMAGRNEFRGGGLSDAEARGMSFANQFRDMDFGDLEDPADDFDPFDVPFDFGDSQDQDTDVPNPEPPVPENLPAVLQDRLPAVQGDPEFDINITWHKVTDLPGFRDRGIRLPMEAFWRDTFGVSQRDIITASSRPGSGTHKRDIQRLAAFLHRNGEPLGDYEHQGFNPDHDRFQVREYIYDGWVYHIVKERIGGDDAPDTLYVYAAPDRNGGMRDRRIGGARDVRRLPGR